MKKIMILSIATASLVAACASPQQIAQTSSAGRIPGCSPSVILIQNLNVPLIGKTASWAATCKGVEYFCSGYNTGSGAYTSVSCAKK